MHWLFGMRTLSRLLLYALAKEIWRRHGIATWPPLTEAGLLAPEERQEA